MQKLPAEPYARSAQRIVQDPGIIPPSKDNKHVNRNFKQPTHQVRFTMYTTFWSLKELIVNNEVCFSQVWKVSHPQTERVLPVRVGDEINPTSSDYIAAPRYTVGMVTGTSKVAGVENIPPPSYQELVSSMSSFVKPSHIQSAGSHFEQDLPEQRDASYRRPSTALARLAMAHSRGFKAQPARTAATSQQPSMDPQWSASAAPLPRSSEPMELKDSSADRAMLYYSHLFPADSTRLEDHHNRTDNLSQSKAVGSKKKVPITRSKELQSWFSHHYE